MTFATDHLFNITITIRCPVLVAVCMRTRWIAVETGRRGEEANGR
jgi:hypothetical protein